MTDEETAHSGHGPVVIIGADGMDPGLTEKWMAARHLPNLDRLRLEGGFARLRTTFPPESPVAWSTFITDTNPGRHGIFGYLHRDGRLSTRLKGNMWKGPFHLPRMQLVCWDECNKLLAKSVV